jgi:hypothetical protein
MEAMYLPAISAAIRGIDDMGSMVSVQRRMAIQSFLINPAGALHLYPQLENDLVSFFSSSSNPHLNEATGLPVKGREVDYERWRIAQEWARTYERYS